jgi:hypothetical protein
MDAKSTFCKFVFQAFYHIGVSYGEILYNFQSKSEGGSNNTFKKNAADAKVHGGVISWS